MNNVIVVSLTNVSREKQQELKDYLETNCWKCFDDGKFISLLSEIWVKKMFIQDEDTFEREHFNRFGYEENEDKEKGKTGKV